MPTFITITDPMSFQPFQNGLSIQIESGKRSIYEDIISDFYKEDDKKVLIIISHNGDEFYFPKEIAKKFVIKINTEY